MTTSSTTATGTSKASPKQKNMVTTKSRYWLMSVIIATPLGVVLAKNWNITGNTK